MSNPPNEIIPRADLIGAVEMCTPLLLNDEDREAVRYFAQHAKRFVAGAWSCEGARCPISGAGIDRFGPGASQFALAFDAEFDANGQLGDVYLFEVAA